MNEMYKIKIQEARNNIALLRNTIREGRIDREKFLIKYQKEVLKRSKRVIDSDSFEEHLHVFHKNIKKDAYKDERRKKYGRRRYFIEDDYYSESESDSILTGFFTFAPIKGPKLGLKKNVSHTSLINNSQKQFSSKYQYTNKKSDKYISGSKKTFIRGSDDNNTVHIDKYLKTYLVYPRLYYLNQCHKKSQNSKLFYNFDSSSYSSDTDVTLTLSSTDDEIENKGKGLSDHSDALLNNAFIYPESHQSYSNHDIETPEVINNCADQVDTNFVTQCSKDKDEIQIPTCNSDSYSNNDDDKLISSLDNMPINFLFGNEEKSCLEINNYSLDETKAQISPDDRPESTDAHPIYDDGLNEYAQENQSGSHDDTKFEKTVPDGYMDNTIEENLFSLSDENIGQIACCEKNELSKEGSTLLTEVAQISLSTSAEISTNETIINSEMKEGEEETHKLEHISKDSNDISNEDKCFCSEIYTSEAQKISESHLYNYCYCNKSFNEESSSWEAENS